MPTSSSSTDTQWFPRLYAVNEFVEYSVDGTTEQNQQIDEIPVTQAEQAETEPQQAEQAEQVEQNQAEQVEENQAEQVEENQAEQVVAVDNSVLVPDYEDTESTAGLRSDIEQEVLMFLTFSDH